MLPSGLVRSEAMDLVERCDLHVGRLAWRQEPCIAMYRGGGDDGGGSGGGGNWRGGPSGWRGVWVVGGGSLVRSFVPPRWWKRG